MEHIIVIGKVNVYNYIAEVVDQEIKLLEEL
jgi:hypothetical protein